MLCSQGMTNPEKYTEVFQKKKRKKKDETSLFVCFLWTHVFPSEFLCIAFGPGAYRGQERMVDPLEQKLQMVVSF